MSMLTVYSQSPSAPAPDPTINSADVISMFSNVYTDVAVDTWLTTWSSAMLTDIQISGNDTKQYENVDFLGIETTGANLIDATAMTTLHLDIWTPNMTTFRVKLVDFGADGVYSPGGDDSDSDLVFNPTPNTWVTLTIPLSDFNFLASRSHLAQMIFSGLPVGSGTVYVDNVYFSNSSGSAQTPTTAAPDPTCAASSVISMFSNVYTDVPVDTWLTGWSSAMLTDLQLSGNDTKLYENVDFLGIETTGANLIDASAMTNFHLDIWTPNMTTFRIKLVDFGPDQAFDGGDDSEHEIVITNPTLNTWISIDIPMSDFTGLNASSNIAQFILSGLPAGGGTVYVDNMYFSDSGCNAMTGPPAAPDPTCDASNVISMFSNVYTDVAVDTWLTGWSSATLTDLQLSGNDTKLYENVDFLGIETTGANLIDASAMTNFHLDIWTPNMTTFRIKIVDFGPDQSFDGGDDSEHEIVITNPTLNTWVSIDIPMSDFTGLNSSSQIAQLIFSGIPVGGGTVYVDNVYYSDSGCTVVQTPQVAAAEPQCDAAEVISLFSNAYTDVGVDTWLTGWSSATLSDIQIAGNDVKLYENVDFLGIETTGANLIDASTMTNFHLDIWTPNMTSFNVKLVDFGADQAFGGGDDSEHQITIANPAQNSWVSLDIPLADFLGLTSTSQIAQIVLSGLPTGLGTVYVDNVYFHQGCDLNPIPPCPVLVWSDEFDGSTLDLTKWTPQIGDGCPSLCGWGNSELEYYRAENAVVANGTLSIIAKEESFGGKNYTSARLRTKDKADFTYGRFEASIKLPVGQGIWPAFWMLSTDEPYGGWPQSGEIDIMEILGQEPDLLHGTIHYGPAWPNNQSSTATYRLLNGIFNDDFHEFAIEWDVNEIRWYIDDYLFSTKTAADVAPNAWPFDHDFHMLLNMAVGGNWPGPPNASTVFPQVMEVDYVRVYKGEFAYLTGNQEVEHEAQGEVYSVENAGAGATYTWAVPAGATIASGQGTDSIVVDWGDSTSSGTVSVTVDACTIDVIELEVNVAAEIVSVLECVLENFDDAALITYVGSTGTLQEDVANPNSNAVNGSALVGEYARLGSEQYDNMTYSTAVISDASLFVNGSSNFSIDIYTSAPIGTTIILQLENSSLAVPSNYPTGRHSRYQITTTVQNEWETLVFQYADRPDASVSDSSVDNLLFLFAPNSFTDDVYYFDNFEKYCITTPMTVTSDPAQCPGTTNTVEVLPAGMPSYTFFVDANLNGAMDMGEQVQSGASNTYSSTTFVDGDVVGVFVEDGNACESYTSIVISTLPTDYTFAGSGGLTGVESGIADYETDGAIESIQTIDVSAIVDYDSAIEVNLLPDFETLLGAQFEAFIDGCNGGLGGQN